MSPLKHVFKIVLIIMTTSDFTYHQQISNTICMSRQKSRSSK